MLVCTQLPKPRVGVRVAMTNCQETRVADLPGILALTPLNPDFNENPHALLDPLRAQCPVHRDQAAGVFILTRHADVRSTLSDTSMWRGPARL